MEFQSVNKMFEQSIKANWDREALSNYNGITLHYRDVARRIAKLHIVFEQAGLAKGDKVAICGRNQANWGVCFLAVLTFGAVPVPILHEFKAGNIHYLVNHSDSKLLFVDEGIFASLLPEEMPQVKVIVNITTLRFLHAASGDLYAIREHLNESFGRKYPDSFGPACLDYHLDAPDELAIINYTSGTSGFSKGVMLPYRSLCSNLEFARVHVFPHLGCGTRIVSILPMAHMYGMMFEFLYEMSIGAHVFFLTKVPSPKVIIQAFGDVKPDFIISVPLVIEKIYKQKLKPVIDRHKLFFSLPLLDKVLENKILGELKASFGGRFEEVIIGGAAFNPEVEKFFRKIGFPFTVGYGMTECAPIIAYSHFNRTRLYSCGTAAPNMELRIDSPDPREIPGEVQARGANVFLGYFKNEAATAESFTEDGWFRTGDIGVMDSDGYLYLKGRSKCMILGPSGQNIYPEEIEAVINNMSYVVDSLAIEDAGGITALIYPDFHQGELDGMTREQLEERITGALAEINKSLPAYSRIARIEVMPEDFERTPKRSIKRYLYQRNTGR